MDFIGFVLIGIFSIMAIMLLWYYFTGRVYDRYDDYDSSEKSIVCESDDDD